jgi:hypothetical protein
LTRILFKLLPYWMISNILHVIWRKNLSYMKHFRSLTSCMLWTLQSYGRDKERQCYLTILNNLYIEPP